MDASRNDGPTTERRDRKTLRPCRRVINERYTDARTEMNMLRCSCAVRSIRRPSQLIAESRRPPPPPPPGSDSETPDGDPGRGYVTAVGTY